MDIGLLSYYLIIGIFSLGYLTIILEYYVKLNKTAVALFIAVACWAVYFVLGSKSIELDLKKLSEHFSDTSQIIFFLLGAMTLVELIDSHKGFKIITDFIQTSSQRKLLWLVSFVTFILSAILDNLTTTILMLSLLRKLLPHKPDRFLLSCMVVVAANAGGAWTPIGDVTTTMLWINGCVTSIEIIKTLFTPSIISLLVPLVYFTFRMKGNFHRTKEHLLSMEEEPGAKIVLTLGVAGLVFVPAFKALTGLPPFMGILISLATLWLVTDVIHNRYDQRQHLRVPYILTKIDTSGVLFFLGILLCINALETVGILSDLAVWLETTFNSKAMIALMIGLLSAIVDNVPIVGATMAMYPLSQFPVDSSIWQMIAYAAGTGGSILIIGSSSGIALMGIEKTDFVSYTRHMSLPVLAGYLVGFGFYLLT